MVNSLTEMATPFVPKAFSQDGLTRQFAGNFSPSFVTIGPSASAVPEPSSIALGALGLGALRFLRRGARISAPCK
ncbi:MAG: PEP-CTERM sorting domain-containing protein [Acidobacteria bacterium]|nr:PEP-CTERM sorting domain-containing protein [Acidobacteriota bacterium]